MANFSYSGREVFKAGLGIPLILTF